MDSVLLFLGGAAFGWLACWYRDRRVILAALRLAETAKASLIQARTPLRWFTENPVFAKKNEESSPREVSTGPVSTVRSDRV